MARYYFHIRDFDAFTPDDEGMELSGLDAARSEALQSVNDLLLEDLKGEHVWSTYIEIADWQGNVLETVPVRPLLH